MSAQSMTARPPHFLLFSGTCRGGHAACDVPDSWRFVLESVNGNSTLEATEAEPGVVGERLELLSVVRGLEALDQPSHVTLVTPSRYITSGMRYGMPEWRENEWRWERFGHHVPVKNADLWQRVDRALKYHRVDCKFWRFDVARTASGGAEADRRPPRRKRGCRPSVMVPASNSAWGSLVGLMRRWSGKKT